MQPADLHKTSRPRVGARGRYHRFLPNGQIDPDPIGEFKITRVEGNLAWAIYDHHEDGDPLPFIWCFKDGLNRLHYWDGRQSA